MSNLEELEEELKQFIIDTLALEDVSADDIDRSMILFGDGLGLDSVDALELGVALHKKYGVQMNLPAEKMQEHFASVQTLAAFVASQLDN